ncbi:MAG: CopG family transcriptional regulator [Myxococcus sp.]|nr:CopG family transcriptional regulator [Myxococcus sp.]
MNQLPIDVDAEAIFLDGSWYTRDDLARKIKSMIDAGDFNVARPSAALEALSATLQQVRTVSFRVTPDLADALNQLATRTGNSVGQLVREAVMQLLTQGAAPQEEVRRDDSVKAAAPTPPDAQPIEAQAAPPEPVLMPGPGALRNAGLDPRAAAPAPIELTRKVEQPTVTSGEGGWFKQ